MFKLHTGVRGAELLLAEPHHFDLNEKSGKYLPCILNSFDEKLY